MKTITTTYARAQIGKIVDAVRDTGDVYAIGRRNKPEVLVIKFPLEYRKGLDDITNVSTYSESFSFLEDEPELYSTRDLKKSYA